MLISMATVQLVVLYYPGVKASEREQQVGEPGSVSPPGVVDGAKIHFDSVKPTGAVIRWAEPHLGEYHWPIEGYRIRMSVQEVFPKVTTGTYSLSHPHAQAGAAVPEWDELTGVSSHSETDYQGELWYRVGGLLPDRLYRFQVQAFNLGGAGAWSESSYALHTPAVPEPPLAPVVLDRTHNTVLLTWSAPSTRGTVNCPDISGKNLAHGVCTTAGSGANVTGFQIYVTKGSADQEVPQQWLPLTLPVTGLKVGLIAALAYHVRGCEPSMTYGFRVSATNAAGESEPGAAVYVSTNTVPAAPMRPQVFAKTHSSIALMWAPAESDSRSPVLGYRLFGSRWDWNYGLWVPASPSVLSIEEREQVSYDELVVEPGEAAYPLPAGLDESEWSELQIPSIEILSGGTDGVDYDAGVVDDVDGSWDEWDWNEGDANGASVAVNEWAGRRLGTRFEGAGWSDFASDTVHEDVLNRARRLQDVNVTNETEYTQGYAHSVYIRGGSFFRDRPAGLVNKTLYYNVNYLMNNQYYKFRVVGINAAGQGAVSEASQVEKLLDAPIQTVQIFSGPPCLYKQQKATKFMAISDGSGVYYRWTTALGSTAGACKTADCSVMEYQYVDVGENMLLVTAINNVGQMLQTLTVNVSYCGCTDRADPNFWWLASYHLPKLCSNIETWPDVDKRVAFGETKFFDLPIPDDAYQAELIVRVERGSVGVYVSSTRLPDILSNITYDQRFVGPEILERSSGNQTGTYTGITTFQVMNTYFDDMSSVVAGQLTGAKWLYIAVVGFDSHSQVRATSLIDHRRLPCISPCV